MSLARREAKPRREHECRRCHGLSHAQRALVFAVVDKLTAGPAPAQQPVITRDALSAIVAPLAAVLVIENGRIVAESAAFANGLGHQRGAVVGEPMEALLWEDPVAVYRPWTGKTVFRHAFGHIVPTVSHWLPFVDGDRLIHVVIVEGLFR